MELKEDGSFDFPAIREAITPKTRVVAIQRSKGYLTRPTLSVEAIGEAIAFVKACRADLICMVDNCYGEFVQRLEPSDLGADMVVGSLIKNPGGGLAPIGGYIAGTRSAWKTLPAASLPRDWERGGRIPERYAVFYQDFSWLPL